MFDIQQRQRDMNALKQVPVSVAQILVQYGQQAINFARDKAKDQPWYLADLPRQAARDNVFWKLDWHSNAVKQLAATPHAIYPYGNDLKKWVMEAYVEANAVQEGAAYTQKAWADMWSEIIRAIATLPVEAAKKVGEALSIPPWVMILGATCLAGLFGYGGYKKWSNRESVKR